LKNGRLGSFSCRREIKLAGGTEFVRCPLLSIAIRVIAYDRIRMVRLVHALVGKTTNA
jgi:hypothetical protein